MASLSFLTGPRTGERIALDKDTVTFGRSLSCDCVLTHPTVSREHFRVERTYGKLFLVDRGSENGTLANGQRVSWVELKHGDRIQAGPFTLIFESGVAPAEASGESAPGEAARVDSPVEPLRSVENSRSLYPVQYVEGIENFNAGRYFDAHEVWEEVWLRSTGEMKLFYQMLIQAAVALHHYERGNARGARGMYANVMEKMARLPSSFMSLDLADFSAQFKARLAELIERDNEAAPTDDAARPRIRLLSNDPDDWGD